MPSSLVRPTRRFWPIARGHLRTKLADLKQALVGSFGAHQRFLVARQLAHIDFLNEQITTVSAEIAERMQPFEEMIQRLDTIPGVGRWGAEVLLAEIGTDMTRFPTSRHLARWAGMCPGSHERAGKRQSGTTRKGSPWLRVMLTEAAYAASRSNGTALSAQYHRIAKRRGRKRAAVAVGHAILVTAWHLLTDGTGDEDRLATVGPRGREAEQRRLIRRLEHLGNTVTVTPRAA